MKEKEMDQVAEWIIDVLAHVGDDAHLEKINHAVADFASRFPLFAYQSNFSNN